MRVYDWCIFTYEGYDWLLFLGVLQTTFFYFFLLSHRRFIYTRGCPRLLRGVFEGRGIACAAGATVKAWGRFRVNRL